MGKSMKCYSLFRYGRRDIEAGGAKGRKADTRFAHKQARAENKRELLEAKNDATAPLVVFPAIDFYSGAEIGWYEPDSDMLHNVIPQDAVPAVSPTAVYDYAYAGFIRWE